MKPAGPPEESADRVIVECRLDEPPEKVWRALTVPEVVAEWLETSNLRAHVGHRFNVEPVHEGREGGEPSSVECEVLTAEPNRLLRYSWREQADGTDDRSEPLDTVVTFVLTETITGGTHLRIEHSGFEVAANEEAVIHEPVAMLGGASAIRRRHARIDPRTSNGRGMRQRATRLTRRAIRNNLRWAA